MDDLTPETKRLIRAYILKYRRGLITDYYLSVRIVELVCAENYGWAVKIVNGTSLKEPPDPEWATN